MLFSIDILFDYGVVNYYHAITSRSVNLFGVELVLGRELTNITPPLALLEVTLKKVTSKSL